MLTRDRTYLRINRMITLEGIDHVALTVRDVEESAKWYQDVLGLDRLHQEVWGSFPAVVGKGNTGLALFPCTASDPKPAPDRNTLAMRHVAFRTDRKGFEAAQSELRSRDIAFVHQDH